MIQTLFLTSSSATASRSRARRCLVTRQLFFQRLHPIALGEDAWLGQLIALSKATAKSSPITEAIRCTSSSAYSFGHRQPHAHAELGIVLNNEFDQAGPRPSLLNV